MRGCCALGDRRVQRKDGEIWPLEKRFKSDTGDRRGTTENPPESKETPFKPDPAVQIERDQGGHAYGAEMLEEGVDLI